MSPRSWHRSSALLTCALVSLLVAATLTATSRAATGEAAGCSSALARAHGTPSRSCAIAIADTFLKALTKRVSADAVPLDAQAALRGLGDAETHAAGGAAKIRAELRASTLAKLSNIIWTVDGAEAFVSFDATVARERSASRFLAIRFTIRNGLIYDVLRAEQRGVSSGGGFPNTPVVAVTGPPAAPAVDRQYNDPTFCSVWLGEHRSRGLTAAQHRSCLIAIATTYVDAEENSAPGNVILFDPRVSRYSLGGSPLHHPSNSDLLRTQEGTFQGTYNRVIRSIDDRHWTVDVTTNQVWIQYGGNLVVSTTHPGFYVAERFTIRDGLIWEIMIAPVVISVP